MITIKAKGIEDARRKIKKLHDEIQRKAMNTAVSAGRREGMKIMRETYSVPAYGIDPPAKYGKPGANTMIKTEKISAQMQRNLDIRAQIISSTRPLGMVRFVPGEPPAVMPQRGIPNAARRQYVARFGRRVRRLGSAFVQRANTAVIVLRRMVGVESGRTGKEKVAKQSLPAASVVLARPENMKRLKCVVARSFKESIAQSIKRCGL